MCAGWALTTLRWNSPIDAFLRIISENVWGWSWGVLNFCNVTLSSRLDTKLHLPGAWPGLLTTGPASFDNSRSSCLIPTGGNRRILFIRQQSVHGAPGGLCVLLSMLSAAIVVSLCSAACCCLRLLSRFCRRGYRKQPLTRVLAGHVTEDDEDDEATARQQVWTGSLTRDWVARGTTPAEEGDVHSNTTSYEWMNSDTQSRREGWVLRWSVYVSDLSFETCLERGEKTM